MTNGVEEPIQITKYSRFVALEGNNPLATTLFSFSRFVVCETIEQTGLQFIERRDCVGHSLADTNVSKIVDGYRLG